MESTVRLGGIEVRRIGLGTNRLKHSPENLEFIAGALTAGVQLIDTAHIYTGGESEATIGEVVSTHPNGHVVATKGGFGEPGSGRPEVLRAQVEESLKRLRTGVIDLYYLHRVDPETPIEDSLGVLRDYRDAGKIRLVGVSQVDVEQVERARSVVPIAAVQNQYNVDERQYDDVVDYCEREGIVFVPFYPLKGVGGPGLADIAKSRGVTPAQVKLAWLLWRSPVMLPIPGTLSLEHVKENLGALELELTDTEAEAVSPDPRD